MTQVECALVNVLEEIYTLALNMFFNALAVHANQLLEKVFAKYSWNIAPRDVIASCCLHQQAELPAAELSSTETINKTLQLLEEILASQDSSVVPVEMRKQNLTQVHCQIPYM